MVDSNLQSNSLLLISVCSLWSYGEMWGIAEWWIVPSIFCCCCCCFFFYPIVQNLAFSICYSKGGKKTTLWLKISDNLEMIVENPVCVRLVFWWDCLGDEDSLMPADASLSRMKFSVLKGVWSGLTAMCGCSPSICAGCLAKGLLWSSQSYFDLAMNEISVSWNSLFKGK